MPRSGALCPRVCQWPCSNAPRSSPLLYGDFVSTLEDAGLAPLQFVADRPMVFPNQIRRLLGRRINQHQRPLKIVNQLVIGEVLHVPQEPIIEALGLLAVT